MKFFKVIFILFIFISPIQADSIYNLIKIPNLEIYKINTQNKLRYLYAKKSFNIGLENNISCDSPQKKNLDKKFKLILKNLNKYNYDFLKIINLKYIVLCKNLSVSGINTAGIPDNTMKTLILDINFNEKYFERVIHHEVFHIINDSFKELFDKNIWSSFNKKDFNYAECSTCTTKLGLDTYPITNGFLTEYSQSTASEDMAEVFSHIFLKLVYKNKDPILKNKIDYIKSVLLKIDENFKL